MVTRADVVRQALDLSKATFDNLYLSLAALQHIVEDAIIAAAGSPAVPGEVEQIVRECVGFSERTRGDLKDTVDRCHALAHDLIDRTFAGHAGEAAAERPPAAAVVVH